MQIVIDIPEKDYNAVKEFVTGDQGRVYYMTVFRAIESGTPLPKGHGRLIDADAYKSEINRVFPCKDKDDTNIRKATDMALLGVPTIIEADKKSEE